MRIEYGHTTITCRKCRAVTAVDNKTLETLTDHKCPNCGMRMTDREMARLKMHLYLLWTQIYNDHCGALVELFDYDIDLHPHTEEDNEAKTEV